LFWSIIYLDRKHWRGDENGLDFEGHATDSQIDEAIPQLEQMALFMKLLRVSNMLKFDHDWFSRGDRSCFYIHLISRLNSWPYLTKHEYFEYHSMLSSLHSNGVAGTSGIGRK
jgi:hypothetical protein